jgi:signal transduction histidine kinase
LGVVFDGGQGDEMLRAVAADLQRSVGQRTFANLRDDVSPLTNGYELALFRWVQNQNHD